MQKGNRESLKEEDYKILGIIFKSTRRRSIVISMLNGCIFPSQIQRETNIGFSTISRNLKNMERSGLVKCQNPSAKTGRIYVLVENVHSLEEVIRKWDVEI
ncbi:MAG: winged helix-turn-helix domain-containing protein [Candidatus Hodarchaeota archaeon]